MNLPWYGLIRPLTSLVVLEGVLFGKKKNVDKQKEGYAFRTIVHLSPMQLVLSGASLLKLLYFKIGHREQ